MTAFVATLSGCAHPVAPVSSLPAPPNDRINFHIVSQGESLMAIAWRYELDLDALAAANGLDQPYPLRPGQRLTLDLDHPSPDRAPIRPAVRTAAKPTSRATRQQPAPGATTARSPAPTLSGQRTAAAPAARPGSAAKPGPTGSTATTPLRWQWPVEGRFTRSYDANNVFKGIAIRSQEGRAVSAAAAGDVVFAGGGLPGYGNLVIIRHNNIYYSAYGHNRKLLVREGATVKAGQTISEVGGEPARPGLLYFEIRERGKPVDPLRFLPRL